MIKKQENFIITFLGLSSKINYAINIAILLLLTIFFTKIGLIKNSLEFIGSLIILFPIVYSNFLIFYFSEKIGLKDTVAGNEILLFLFGWDILITINTSVIYILTGLNFPLSILGGIFLSMLMTIGSILCYTK